jgi:N-carbamoylputrescine amidase
MRAALIVNRITANREHNLQEVLAGTSKAAAMGAELVMFPEAALTGLANNDRPARDLGFGVGLHDPEVRAMAAMARSSHVLLAIGLLERAGSRLYDTAVLFSPDDAAPHVYHRITPGWHGKRAAPQVYAAGLEVATVRTPLGALGFLVCGDLFDDGLVKKMKALAPDWLLVPLARCFKNGTHDDKRWVKEEQPIYVERVRRAGITTLIVNSLADRHLDGGSFGGAMVVAPDGEVLVRLPLGNPGILFADLPGPEGSRERRLIFRV